MLVICKESNLDKIKPNLFRIVSISDSIVPAKDNDVVITPMPFLGPTSKLKNQFHSGDVSKSDLQKKYRKFLKNSKLVETFVFNIGVSMEKPTRGICFICSDEEWEMGYIQIFAKHLNKTFGVKFIKVSKLKDIYKEFNKEVKSLPKKKRKGKAAKKKLKSIVKNTLSKYMEFSSDGEETMDKLRRRFAVDHVMISALAEKFYDGDGNKIKVIKDNLGKMKKKSFVKAIMTSADEDKKYKKIIKSVLDSHNVKFKEKKLEKLSKQQILYLCGDICSKLNEYRSGDSK